MARISLFLIALASTVSAMPAASAQSALKVEERQRLLQEALDQLTPETEQIRPALLAGWGTLEQVLKVGEEYGWEHIVKLSDLRVGDWEKSWEPGASTGNSPSPRMWVQFAWIPADEAADSGDTVYSVTLWRFLLCQNSDRTVLRVLWNEPWQEWEDEGSGLHPLHNVVMEGSLVVMEWMLQQGVDPNQPSEKYGLTPLMLVSECEDNATSAARLNRLIRGGADVNARDYRGGTALTAWTLGYKSTQIADLLVAHGAKLDISLPDGRNLLHFAAMFARRADTLRWLLQHGVDPAHANRDGTLPLDYARESNGQAAEEYVKILEPLSPSKLRRFVTRILRG